MPQHRGGHIDADRNPAQLADPGDSGHRKVLVHGHRSPTGGQFVSRSADISSLTVAARSSRREVLPRRFRCSAAGGPALRVGLPTDDLGFCSHGLGLLAEAVSEPAGFRRFPPVLCVITGFMSACREFLMTANTGRLGRPVTAVVWRIGQAGRRASTTMRQLARSLAL